MWFANEISPGQARQSDLQAILRFPVCGINPPCRVERRTSRLSSVSFLRLMRSPQISSVGCRVRPFDRSLVEALRCVLQVPLSMVVGVWESCHELYVNSIMAFPFHHIDHLEAHAFCNAHKTTFPNPHCFTVHAATSFRHWVFACVSPLLSYFQLSHHPAV